MAYTNAISASDPLAIEKLTQKLDECQDKQAFMKAVNAYYRKNGTCKGFPELTDEQVRKIESAMESHFADRQPFPAWQLQNNNQEIGRLKKRIEQISRDREVGFTGWDFNGGHAVADQTDKRLRLFFDQKPDEQQRSQLKLNGFKWAPSVGAWQRQLNTNAIYAADRVEFLKPINGSTVRSIQPKTPNKDTMER